MTIENVHSPKQLQRVETLAREIWAEHYTPIIGRAQVAYMLETFQNSKAMAQQLGEGYLYYLLREGEEDIGYMAVKAEGERLFLSKLYVKASHRGRGHGKAAVAFLSEMAEKEGLQTIELTVNRHNTDSISAYERLGFVNKGAIEQPIGEGFVMDDYKMEKPL